MARRVAIIDTSLMCCWLRVPGRDTAGSEPDRWDFQRTERVIQDSLANGYDLVFPMTTLIETGNHISHASHSRRERAVSFVEKLREALDGSRPWASFTDQFSTIGAEALVSLCAEWPNRVGDGVSIGDFLITTVADYYGRSGFEVKIISSDQLLRSHVAASPSKIPRRRGG